VNMTVTKHTAQLRSFDDLRLFVSRWTPDGPPQALLIIIHGYGEHSRRYTHVARYFAERGFAVAALDYRGHGLSEGPRATVIRFHHVISDIEVCYNWARQFWPDLPVYLIGHSLGALATLLFLLSADREVAGVVLSGAPLAAACTPWPLVQLARVLNRVTPGWRIVPINPFGITRNREVIRASLADPLMTIAPISAHLAHEIIGESRFVLNQLSSLETPILYLHGAKDGVVSATGSQKAYERTGGHDKTLIIYPELAHELFNEPEREQVLADVFAWLQARVGG